MCKFSSVLFFVFFVFVSVAVGVAAADTENENENDNDSNDDTGEITSQPEVLNDVFAISNRMFRIGNRNRKNSLSVIVTFTHPDDAQEIPNTHTDTDTDTEIVDTTTTVRSVPENNASPRENKTEAVEKEKERRPQKLRKSPDPNMADHPVPVPVPVNGGPTLKDKVRQIGDLDESLLNWEAPMWFQRNVPYYLAGHDDDGRPVWIKEIGRYPLKELGELDEEGYRVFDKYISQMALRIIKSVEAQNTTEREVTDAFFILDFDGFETSQIASPKSILLMIRILRTYSDLLIRYTGATVAINVNYVAEFALSVARPVLGRAFDKIEIYGTNSAKWKNVLRKRLPEDAIPEWYGGALDFKPLKVYG